MKGGFHTKKKNTWSHDVAVAILLLAASAFLMFNALTQQSAEARQFPVLILTVFMILAAVMLINGIRDTMALRAGKEVKVSNLKWAEIKYPLIAFVFMVVYVIAVDFFGFVVPSLVFTAALMWFNYARNKIALVLVPCGLVGFLYVLFTFVLQTKMP